VVDHFMMTCSFWRIKLGDAVFLCGGKLTRGAGRHHKTVVCVPNDIDLATDRVDLREICRPFNSSTRIFRASCQPSGI